MRYRMYRMEERRYSGRQKTPDPRFWPHFLQNLTEPALLSYQCKKNVY